LNNAANQIVYCEDSSAVDSVMIGGQMVLSGRRFTRFDYEKLRAKVQSTMERLSLMNRETKEWMDGMAAFVSQHCVGLAGEPYHVHRRLDY
jgi:guanine deaminase